MHLHKDKGYKQTDTQMQGTTYLQPKIMFRYLVLRTRYIYRFAQIVGLQIFIRLCEVLISQWRQITKIS